MNTLRKMGTVGSVGLLISGSLIFGSANAAVATAESPWGTADAVLAPVLENFSQIEPLLKDERLRAQLDEIKRWSLEQAQVLRDLAR